MGRLPLATEERPAVADDAQALIEEARRRQRRRHRWFGAWLLVALVGTGVGLALTRGFGGPPERPAHSGSTSPPATSLVACLAQTPKAWQEAAGRILTRLPGDTGYVSYPPVFATSPDGSNLYYSYYSSGWSGVVRLNVDTGRARRIYRFPDGAADEIGTGEVQGRWVIWEVTNFGTAGLEERLVAWNAVSGATTVIAESPSLPSLALLSYVVDTESEGSTVAWSIEGYSSGMPDSPPAPAIAPVVSLYSLAEHTNRVIFHGFSDEMFFWNHELVYVPSSPSGALPRSVSVSTGAPLHVTVGVSELASRAGIINSDDSGVVVSDSAEVLVMKRGAKVPVVFSGYSVSNGIGFLAPTLVGHYMLWGPGYGSTSPPVYTAQGLLIANLQSGKYISLPLTNVFALGEGSTIVIESATASNSESSSSTWRIALMHPGNLPRFGACQTS